MTQLKEQSVENISSKPYRNPKKIWRDFTDKKFFRIKFNRLIRKLTYENSKKTSDS